jgi:hypothetical protein
MKYTLYEIYDGELNEEYDIEIPEDQDPETLGLVYFAFHCSDVNSYNEGGPLKKRRKNNNLYVKEMKYLSKMENTPLKKLSWIYWYLKR